MLWLIGLGINGFKGISIYAINILKDMEIILLERYTSPIYEDVKELEGILKKQISIVPRWYVEDAREILELAEKHDLALLTYGDPLVATTHMELVVRAKEKGIGVKIIHNASSITSILGACGLHIYKLGRVATLVSEQVANKAIYKIIYNNLLQGLHTLLLLEYDQEKGFFLDPRDGLQYLLECEGEIRYNIINKDTFAIVASRIGYDDTIYAGRIDSLLKQEFGRPPHSIIITGSLHFTEYDALRYLRLLDKPIDNSKGIKKRAEEMVSKYIPKARRALEKAKSISLEYFDTTTLLDNAERYIDDAESFLNKGEYELAILSIGYGEGLIDAIGYLKEIDLWSDDT